MNIKTVIIIGGGAAGFFCAANIHHPSLRVIILEKSDKLLSKVKISGGGRCNVTNGKWEQISAFAQSYPRGKNLLKKTLHHFNHQDTIQWFKNRGVNIVQEPDGRMFPETNNSQSIIDCLLNTVQKNKVIINTKEAVQNILRINDNQYEITTNKDIKYIADYVVLATGGIQKIEQLNWLKNINVNIIPPNPSLFTFNLPKHPITQLMGVAVSNAQVKIHGEKLVEKGPILITHWGLSGPAVLRLSAWGANLLAEKKWIFKVQINWLDNYNEESLRQDIDYIRSQQGNKLIYNKNPFHLPNRLWEYLLKDLNIDENITWSTLKSKDQNRLITSLTTYTLEVNGKTTFKEEFVSAGGIDLQEINAKNLSLHKHPNLYAIGEVTNIDGITGGYNFQNAWTSGYIVAKDILSI